MRRSAVSVAMMMLVSPSVFAHAMLMDPTARTPCNGTTALCKSPPCGTVSAGSPVKTFSVGTSYTIAWQETIEHPGHYRLALSTNAELGFNSYILADNLGDTTGAAPHNYTWNWLVPNTFKCDPCVLQMTQYMSENMNTYYSCSDIRIVGATGPTPTPGASPTPTPTPGGNPDDATIHGSCACAIAGAQTWPGTATALMTLAVFGLAIRRRSRAA